jgi:hypothetical protein
VSTQLERLITYAHAYDAARKRDKSVLLDEVVGLTGWTRDHARKRMVELAAGAQVAAPAPVYSDEAVTLLEAMWLASGCMSGRYLAEALPRMLANLERDPAFTARYGPVAACVHAEVTAMSAATIDRYAARARERHCPSVPRVFASRLAQYLVRTRARCRQQGTEPGTFVLRLLRGTQEGAGPGTVVLIDTHTRWISVRTALHPSWVDLTATLQEAIEAVPYGVMAVHDSADALPRTVAARVSAYLGVPILNPVDGRPVPDLFNLPAPPSVPVDAEAAQTVAAVNVLWSLLTDRINLMCPFKVPGSDDASCDELWTPVDRLTAAGVLSQPQERRILQMHRNHCPVDVARAIDHASADVCDRLPDRVVTAVVGQEQPDS